MHHIVFRSQAPYMKEVKLNHKYLCIEHHRGNSSPHRNREIDLKYKKELQKKLLDLFPKAYYTVEEIGELLGISELGTYRIVKTLKLHEEGYERVDLVIRMMGGMMY
nr:hypothetical protein [Clostridium ganghwense]